MDSNSKQIRVVIVDDHKMVRMGLKVLMEDFEDLEVIDEAGDGEAALEICLRREPDVVLMDMVMPRLAGVEATRRIRAACPRTQIVALTSFGDESNVQEAIKAGAIGYLLKNITGNELAEAIRRAYAGESTLAPEATQALIRATVRPPAPGHDLTDREREVLALLIEGLNNREIGERLVISSSTAKNHVSSILSKLDTTSRTQAVALAVEHGILND